MNDILFAGTLLSWITYLPILKKRNKIVKRLALFIERCKRNYFIEKAIALLSLEEAEGIKGEKIGKSTTCFSNETKKSG